MRENEYLEHFGILGMKWGVRRQRGSDGRVVSDDHATSRQLKSKHVSELSTKELQSLTGRLQLEKQYKQLNPDDIEKGLNVVKRITSVGTTVAALYAVSKTPLGQDVIKVLKKAK